MKEPTSTHVVGTQLGSELSELPGSDLMDAVESYSISQEICARFLLCCALLWLYIDWFPHIRQAYFTGTVAI